MIEFKFKCAAGAPQNAHTWGLLRNALHNTATYTKEPDKQLVDIAIDSIKAMLKDMSEYKNEGLDKALNRIMELYDDGCDASCNHNPTWPAVIDVESNHTNMVTLKVGTPVKDEYHSDVEFVFDMGDHIRLDPQNTLELE